MILDLTEFEVSLLKASFKFVHLNRMAFYKYLSEQGHGYLAEEMEEHHRFCTLYSKMSDVNHDNKDG